MSMELHVLIDSAKLPDIRKWQTAIDSLGFDVKVDPSVIVETDTGFLPATYKGRKSGFEFDVSASSDIISAYGDQASNFKDADLSANFRWGGDLDEIACALVASAALTKLTGGVWFDPQEGICSDATGAVEQAKAAVAAQ